jgi:hypothetical protein
MKYVQPGQALLMGFDGTPTNVSLIMGVPSYPVFIVNEAVEALQVRGRPQRLTCVFLSRQAWQC